MKSENPPSHIVTALEKFTDQHYKPMFTFLLRNQSGFGDTIDRFDPKLFFKKFLEDMSPFYGATDTPVLDFW